MLIPLSSTAASSPVILRPCLLYTSLTKEGKLDESQIMDLSELVLGTKKLRTSDDQFVAAASMGLGALDIICLLYTSRCV